LQTTYYDAGQFYWGGLTAWSEQNDILSNGVGLEIPNWRAIDFDGEDDWIRAESIAKYLFIERLKNEL
jgi:N-acylneuraminate cytidylyltransferase